MPLPYQSILLTKFDIDDSVDVPCQDSPERFSCNRGSKRKPPDQSPSSFCDHTGRIRRYDANWRRFMILITGATGNNGRELVRQLVAAGEHVRALVRDPAKATTPKGQNVELVMGDFDQPATLD